MTFVVLPFWVINMKNVFSTVNGRRYSTVFAILTLNCSDDGSPPKRASNQKKQGLA